MRNWRNAFSIMLLAGGLFAVLQSFAPAKIERSKVIKKDFDGKAEIAAAHQYGPLTVKKSQDGRVHLTAEMFVTGNEEADIEAMLNRFDVDVQESSNRLAVATNLGIESCNSVNGKSTIKYKDGLKLKGVGSYRVNMTLEVPDPEKLSLTNKYDKIELLDNYSGKLSVDLYSGELSAMKLSDLNLDLKYGKAKLQNIANGNLEIYDSELRMGNASDLKVSSKYSEYELGNVNNITLETYDDHWRLGNVGGKLVLADKYSDFVFGNLNTANMTLFDGEIKAGVINELTIDDTKYAEYRLDNVGKLTMGNVFDDDFKIAVLGSLTARSSKYTEYRVEKLTKSFEIQESFDDDVQLSEVAADFSLIQLDGKYTEMTLDIAEGARFELNVDMQYGKVKYPQERVAIQKYLEKNNRLEVVGNVGTKAADGSFSSLKLAGFDNTLTWN